MALKIHVINARELAHDAALLERWRAIIGEADVQTSTLASPYFTPDFTLAVAAVRESDDVRVAVLEDGARGAVGFFPCQRGRAAGACEAVGGALSDHHGVITRETEGWSWPALLSAVGCSHLKFDHLMASQAPSSSLALASCSSPALDLSVGYDAYRKRHSGSRRMSEHDRKARKLAREIGPLRFEAHDTSTAALEQVLALKSAQCRRTGVHDYFTQLRWPRALVEHIWQTQEPPFAGALSTLYAGDKLVAANFGMRTPRVWHWWFPVYDHACAKYSPGAILLLHVAEAAARERVALVDLGKGDDDYKATFADVHLPLVEGLLVLPTLANAARGALFLLERHARTIAQHDALQPLKDVLRPLRSRLRWSG